MFCGVREKWQRLSTIFCFLVHYSQTSLYRAECGKTYTQNAGVLDLDQLAEGIIEALFVFLEDAVDHVAELVDLLGVEDGRAGHRLYINFI